MYHVGPFKSSIFPYVYRTSFRNPLLLSFSPVMPKDPILWKAIPRTHLDDARVGEDGSSAGVDVVEPPHQRRHRVAAFLDLSHVLCKVTHTIKFADIKECSTIRLNQIMLFLSQQH